ncbi:hypothetical protein TNCV_2519861 [Trichonephila clavipes]|nr:hypothetical protein TNCV_2519861 [Trichonephila clavipes]
MGMTNQHRTCGSKRCLEGEKWDKSSLRENDEPDEWSGQTNVAPWRWIGRGVPIALPPRFPDLNPLDFFFWSHLKSLEYETLVVTMEDLTAWIIVTSAYTGFA